MALSSNHQNLSGDQLHDAFHYVQDSDPGAVGTGKYWLDTSSEPYLLYRRNEADDDWVSVGSVFVSPVSDNAYDESAWNGDATHAPSKNAVRDKFEAMTSYIDSVAVNLGKRARVRAATTANITISTALNNSDTLDGVTLATGDLVLVKNQSSAAENGIYVVGVSPARSSEFDTYDEHPGSLIAVEEGTAGADTLWLCTSNIGGTINSTSIAFSSLVITTAVDDTAYDATTWNSDTTHAPSKNAIRDKIESLGAGFTPSHFVLPILAPDSNTSFSNLSSVDSVGLTRYSAGTVNNELVWNVNLPAGTYSVFMVHSKANNRGKYHFIFDGSDLGNIDGYDSSGSGVFTYSSLTGLTVTGGSPVVLEMKMSDKNASSAGYYGVPYQLVLVRTGA